MTLLEQIADPPIGKGSGRRWRIKSVDLLRALIERHGGRISPTARELGISYITTQTLLEQTGLLSLVSKRNKDPVSSHDGYLYASEEHDSVNGLGHRVRKFKHILAMEQKLGRPLMKGEMVHHVNLDKTDNRPENLTVCDRSSHRKIHNDLEHLAGRLIEAGYIAYVPELSQYVFVGPKPTLRREVGNKGFVRIVDVLGSDATVVNAARISFGKSVAEIRDQDKKLLTYLATHGHTSPFRHVYVQLHVKAPEFVARQWYKHVVGTEYSFKDTPWNEISGRYVEYELDAFKPDRLRAQAIDKKQGSAGEPLENDAALLAEFSAQVDSSMAAYKYFCEKGVAKEQARMLLPLTFYTEWYWTASLQALSHFVKLRTDSHAQFEIQSYANAVNDCMLTLFPNAWKALETKPLL